MVRQDDGHMRWRDGVACGFVLGFLTGLFAMAFVFLGMAQEVKDDKPCPCRSQFVLTGAKCGEGCKCGEMR